jgi:hypothetical protein
MRGAVVDAAGVATGGVLGLGDARWAGGDVGVPHPVLACRVTHSSIGYTPACQASNPRSPRIARWSETFSLLNHFALSTCNGGGSSIPVNPSSSHVFVTGTRVHRHCWCPRGPGVVTSNRSPCMAMQARQVRLSRCAVHSHRSTMSRLAVWTTCAAARWASMVSVRAMVNARVRPPFHWSSMPRRARRADTRGLAPTAMPRRSSRRIAACASTSSLYVVLVMRCVTRVTIAATCTGSAPTTPTVSPPTVAWVASIPPTWAVAAGNWVASIRSAAVMASSMPCRRSSVMIWLSGRPRAPTSPRPRPVRPGGVGT